MPPQGRQVVQSFRPGGFTVSGVRYAGSIIVHAEAMGAWPPATVDGLDPATIVPLAALAGRVDVLLIGTGATFRPVPPPLLAQLAGAGLKVEVMATPAACRTYNVLVAENRRVAAALLALPGP